jgi:hypothetical protein
MSGDKNLQINSEMFNNGNRPTMDAVQSGLGNAPVMRATGSFTPRTRDVEKEIEPRDHFRYYQDSNVVKTFTSPYPNETSGTRSRT